MPGILQAVASFTSAAAAGWAFQSAGSVVTGASPTVTLPATHGAGSLLVIIMNGGATNITTPAGWTAGINVSGAGTRFLLCYKMDGGSETNVAITGGAAASTAVMISYSGINATPLDVNGVNSGTLTTTSLTTLAANDLVISAYATSTTGTWTGTPASTNVRVNSGGGTTDSILVVDELQAVAGATTARAATSSSTGASPIGYAISFKI